MPKTLGALSSRSSRGEARGTLRDDRWRSAKTLAPVDGRNAPIRGGMELHPLAPRARILFHLQALSSLAFLWLPMVSVLTVGLVAVWQLYGALLLGAVVAMGVFILSIWMPSLTFDRWGYLLRQEDLLIARGVWVRRVTSIPTHRIQHVDTQQGPLEQWLGLARVQVHTASGLGADGVIPGLQLDDAEALRDVLMERSQTAADDGV